MTKSARTKLWGGLGLVVLIALATWFAIPQHPRITIGDFTRDLNFKLGLDLQGGSHLVYRAKVEEGEVQDSAEALAGVRDVIERRVNAFGVSEPVVQTNRVGEEHRVIVELAGVHDPEEAIRLIGETPQLDFRREVQNADALEQLNIDATDEVQVNGPLFERTDLTGKNLKRATVEFDQSGAGVPFVGLEFDSEGSDLFARLTEENLGKRIAIYLDGVPISAPIVQTQITNGRAVITGGFTLDEAKQLARRLNAGALPVPIELISQQTIGPSLGKLSIAQSITAGAYGLLVVILWMLLYYRLPGLVAAIALIIYTVFFMALVKLIPITLTLAGVAGFILSIGMAVDANVLIFERLRENLRAGREVGYALRDGFKQAWDSIWVSNVSSLITGFVLYGFGTSFVRGFALTFSIGILLSMFTAVTITRGLLTSLLDVETLRKPFFLGVKKKN